VRQRVQDCICGRSLDVGRQKAGFDNFMPGTAAYMAENRDESLFTENLLVLSLCNCFQVHADWLSLPPKVDKKPVQQFFFL